MSLLSYITPNTKVVNKKSYTILDFPSKGKTSGRFISTNMNSAAHKAMSKLSKHYNIDSDSRQFLTFWMKEITTGSSKKEVQYIGTRVKLVNPIIRNINNKEIIHNYKYIITKYDEKNFKLY